MELVNQPNLPPAENGEFFIVLGIDIPPAMIGAAAVSMAMILISAYSPARKAANMPVMECIRQTNEVKAEAQAIKTSKLAQRISPKDCYFIILIRKKIYFYSYIITFWRYLRGVLL